MEILELSDVVRRNGKCALENSSAVPQNGEHKVTDDPAIPLLGVCLRTENLRPHKNLYMNTGSSISHGSPKADATQMSSQW